MLHAFCGAGVDGEGHPVIGVTWTGRVDSLCRLLAKLRPCRALRAPGRLSKAHRSRTLPFGLPSRSARPHHTDQSIGQCSDDLGAPRYRPSLSLTLRFASMVAGSTAPRPARGQHERRPDEEAHRSENVPALASVRSIRVSVLGNTKLAIADAMKATEPSMLSHAIDQVSSRNCGRQNATPRAEIAYALDTRNRTEPKKSGRQTCLSASAALRLCTVAANVLMLKKSVPGNCVTAASQFLSRGRQAHSRAWMRVCWRCSSTPVIPGLCACTNWQYDADVKKIDPTKKVMASAFAPTACKYAGG